MTTSLAKRVLCVALVLLGIGKAAAAEEQNNTWKIVVNESPLSAKSQENFDSITATAEVSGNVGVWITLKAKYDPNETVGSKQHDQQHQKISKERQKLLDDLSTADELDMSQVSWPTVGPYVAIHASPVHLLKLISSDKVFGFMEIREM